MSFAMRAVYRLQIEGLHGDQQEAIAGTPPEIGAVSDELQRV